MKKLSVIVMLIYLGLLGAMQPVHVKGPDPAEIAHWKLSPLDETSGHRWAGSLRIQVDRL